MTPAAESMCRKLAPDADTLARLRMAMEWAYRDAAAVCRAQIDPDWPNDDISQQAASCASAIEARLK